MPATRTKLEDCGVIAGLVLLSAALYLRGLGFYSDDWSILAHYLVGGPDHGFAALLGRALDAHDIAPRPFYAVYITVLYRIFGMHPLGYHLVNTVVLACGAALLYLVLRELRQPRLIALAVALVYALLPHYSTDRFWYISFHVPLSMTTWCLSLYADLRATALASRGRAAWRALALASMVASLLTYEIFLPLFFLNAVVARLHWRRLAESARAPAREMNLAAGVQWAVIVALALVKASLTGRLPGVGVAEHVSWFARFLGRAAESALAGDFGLRLPGTLAVILRDHDDPAILAGGVFLGVAVAAWLLHAAREGDGLERARMRNLAACGVVVFLAGYAIFFVAFNAAISSTGMNNRTAMAAALGIALAWVGAAGWASAWIRHERWRRGLFCAAMGLACASGFVIVNTLGVLWGEAAARQRLVLADLGPRLAGLPPGSMILLDGMCPYVGPAPVFDSAWDFTGALHILSGGTSLGGDVVTPKLRVQEEGVYTRMYQFVYGPYPWTNLYVYNFARQAIFPVQGPYAMTTYLRDHDPTRGGDCPPGEEGEGVRVFR